MLVKESVPLAPCTTLRLGGPAARWVEVEHEEELLEALELPHAREHGVFVLGGGSNVVVGDEGFPGLVLRMAMRGVRASIQGGRAFVEVGAGESWDALVGLAVDEGWGGIEALAGIPGLVGGTPIQNVGAYGQEVAETIDRVRVFDRAAGGFFEFSAADCGFTYRGSRFKRSDRYVVTGVTFAFPLRRTGVVRYAELARALGVREGEEAPARAVREAVIALRRAKGMVLDPADPESVSAGSFFVNPIVDERGLAAVEERARAAGALGTEETIPRFATGDGRWKLAAAWLVERAGFPKGYGRGHVGVSRKHALALVHRGGGSTSELLAIARAIRDGVRDRFGVELQVEPVLVGCAL